MTIKMYWFLLWREFKLSIAEILTVFQTWKTVYFDKQILILEWITKNLILEKAKNLWWTIKIIEINDEKIDIKDLILNIAKEHEWKFRYWLNQLWLKNDLRKSLLEVKKILKENSLSSRFINKDFKNLKSSQIIWENLIKRGTDFNVITTNEKTYTWISIWVQDIESYSDRDYSKDRDMQVWMLPPKLSQIMINLSEWNSIYDPFVWLWTVLIESIYMWNKNIYWSDLSERMVETSDKNIDVLVKKIWLNDINKNIFIQNSKYIHEISEKIKIQDINAIVTEWYLWEVMTKKNINIDRINKQRENLKELYNWFFSWLKEIGYKKNIVISFPFWEIKWKYIFFNEIYDIINKYCEVIDIFKNNELNLTTKEWSLLYKRDSQLVWREIFKLKIKD